MGKARANNHNSEIKHSWWDLIDDEKTGRIQASKVWLHIGNFFASYKFLQVPAANLTYDMLTAYLAIITLGYGGLYWLKSKGANDGNSEMVVEQQSSSSSATVVTSNKSSDQS